MQLEEAAKMETKRQSVAENVAAMARAAEAAAARRLAAAEAAAQTKATATPAAEPSGRDNADEPATAAVAAEEENEAGVAEGAEGDYCSQHCHDGLHTIIDVCLHRSAVYGVSTVPDQYCFVLGFAQLLQLLTELEKKVTTGMFVLR